MSVLDTDIFDKLITVGDRYLLSQCRINIPVTYDGFADDISQCFPFRFEGFEYSNTARFIRSISEQIKSEILDAPITKVQGTTQRYAHIKRCIKKHVYFHAYHCKWLTQWTWAVGKTWREPKTVYVTVQGKLDGKYKDLISIQLTLKDSTYNEPF